MFSDKKIGEDNKTCLPRRSFGLQWHVTNRCDQRCKHCYIWSSENKEKIEWQRELNLRQCISVIDNFLRFCKKFKVSPSINITGGDPLLFGFIWELLSCLKERNLSFMIMGNPFHLDDDTCKKLKILGCRSYQMSLDGLEQIHDSLRKEGSFKATVQAIKKLKVSGIKTVIMSTVSRLNYRDIPKLIEVVVENEVDVYDFARYCPVSGELGVQFTPQEYRNFLAEMWEVYTRLADRRTKFSLKDHLWRLFLYEKGLFKIRRGENIVLQGCNCGISHLTLLPDGVVYACRRFESSVGDILSQSFQEIFLGREIDKYRAIEKMDGCKDCELLNYCRGCHAVSYWTYGSFFTKDPQCWKVY